MASRLQISAGPCPRNLTPIIDIVNTSESYKVSSNVFEGEIAVHIKDFIDENGIIRHSDYFQRNDRNGVTWSIQVAGRFLQPRSADDILFGNIFERPLSLPWGSSAIFNFMSYIDPTLEHALLSQTKPWALSPLISTMPHFSHKRADSGAGQNDFSKHIDPQTFLENDFTGQLHLASVAHVNSLGSDSPDVGSGAADMPVDAVEHTKSQALSTDYQFASPAIRRKYFSKEENRRAIQFGPDDIVTMDFCYGFLEFSPTIALRLPGGLSFDLTRYWDGQPVTFVCCERGRGGEPWGDVFWCVVIESSVI